MTFKAKSLVLFTGALIVLTACVGDNKGLPDIGVTVGARVDEPLASIPTPTNKPIPIGTLTPTVTATPTFEPNPTSVPTEIPNLTQGSGLIESSICTTHGMPISDQLEYIGPLIDAHVHLKIWGFTYPIESLISAMDEAGIVKAIVHDDFEIAMSAYNRYPERIIPFIRPKSPQKNESLTKLEKELNTGEFYGIGEVSLRHWSRRMGKNEGGSTSIEGQKREAGGGKGVETPGNSPNMKKILDLAAQYDVPVAVHLDNIFSDELKSLLGHNRKGIVIWSHVGTTPLQMTDPRLVSRMMDKHPNLYADLSAVSPYMKRSSLLDLEGNLDQDWMELLERHSDRFLFGIDVFLEEHLVFVTSETSYWRKVLGKLPPETAIRIGCSNIEGITSSVGTGRN
jgi:predicted TIM-barrel fold metal-dependent hydrolase